MEDPGYSGASQAFESAGGRIVPVPVDQEGLIVKAGRKLAPQAKLAYVTPANQFPMGVTMPADRRVELLRWLLARTHGSLRTNTMRDLMSALCHHAMRYEWIERYPIKLVRQSAKREKVPDVLDCTNSNPPQQAGRPRAHVSFTRRGNRAAGQRTPGASLGRC